MRRRREVWVEWKKKEAKWDCQMTGPFSLWFASSDSPESWLFDSKDQKKSKRRDQTSWNFDSFWQKCEGKKNGAAKRNWTKSDSFQHAASMHFELHEAYLPLINLSIAEREYKTVFSNFLKMKWNVENEMKWKKVDLPPDFFRIEDNKWDESGMGWKDGIPVPPAAWSHYWACLWSLELKWPSPSARSSPPVPVEPSQSTPLHDQAQRPRSPRWSTFTTTHAHTRRAQDADRRQRHHKEETRFWGGFCFCFVCCVFCFISSNKQSLPAPALGVSPFFISFCQIYILHVFYYMFLP